MKNTLKRIANLIYYFILPREIYVVLYDRIYSRLAGTSWVLISVRFLSGK